MTTGMDAYHQSLAETQREVLQRMENNRVLAQQQEIQKTQDDSQSDQERLREAEEIATQVWEQSRRAYDPVNIDKSVTGPAVQLIKEAVFKCIAYGVPARAIPPFTTNPAYFAEKDNTNASAAYDGISRAVWVNLASPVWKQQAERPITDWHSTVNLTHALTHEISHSLHRDKVGAAWMRPFTPDAKFQEIAKRVSEYAATDNCEFVAEVFCGLVNGSQYGEEVMSLYRRLGGWERPSSVQKGESAPPVPIHVEVPAPVVHVHVPPAQVTVNVPAPVVNVNPAITVEQKPSVETFEVFRDKAGNMTGGRKTITTKE